jgi:hypothetical protein
MSDKDLVGLIKDGYYKDWSDQRRDSLEATWSMAYDAYRGDYSSGNLERWKALEGTTWRSKVFVRLTKMKVVAAVSQINDVYFQGGKLPFSVTPTPIPDDMQGMALDPKIAEERAGRMSKRIEDIFVECRAAALQKMANLEMAIYGMSVLKAPVMRQKERLSYQMQTPPLAAMADMFLGTQLAQKYGRHVLTPQMISIPMVEHPNLWDMFWDMEGDFQEGQGVIQRVMMSPAMLRKYALIPGFDRKAIDSVISKMGHTESSSTTETNLGPGRDKIMKSKRNIRVLDCCVSVPVKTLRETALYNEKDDGREREIITIIADDEVIFKAQKNPWPGNLRPYHLAVWEAIPHESHGIGVPENLKDSQMMINGSVRTYIDNKSLAGNVLMAGNPRMLAPGQNRTVYPGKYFELAENVQDVREALQFFSPPDIGGGMLEMINLFERFADEESNLPKLLEGQKQVGDPKTAFAFGKLVEAANKALGNVIKNIDDGQTQPIVDAFYHWLMVTDPDENIKGDYNCKANGFGVYSDRVIQGDNLQMFLAFMLGNEILSAYPKTDVFLQEIAKCRNIDPDKFLKTVDEVTAEMMQKMQAEIQMQAAANGIAPPPGQGGPEEEVPPEEMAA